MTYHYSLLIHADDGRELAQVPVEPDWQPALECAAFDGVRRGGFERLEQAPAGTVVPVWHGALGEPYVERFRLELGDEPASEIGIAYLAAEARRASAALVERGALQAGEPFTYLICAFPEARGAAAAEEEIAVETLVATAALVESRLDAFATAATRLGEMHDGDVPVFVPQGVLDEVVALARRDPEVETGGILLGRLHRDRGVPEVFVEITAQIPAAHAVATATKLTFTAETWAAADAARNLRRRGESFAGWWHSHIQLCRRCPEERRRVCAFSRSFFSADDVHLHRVCFGRPYQVALLASDHGEADLDLTFYGWRRGTVAARGFYATPAPTADARTARPTARTGT